MTYDVTARKVHQWAIVAMIAIGFLFGGANGVVLLALSGAVMLLGRYWWPADVFRQLTWRLLEPAGLLRRRELHEDHETRRIARVAGGGALLVSALLVAVSLAPLGWIVAFAIGIMVAADAAADFCALCFAARLVRR